jgi:predicted amidophosphoribosyltransferase
MREHELPGDVPCNAHDDGIGVRFHCPRCRYEVPLFETRPCARCGLPFSDDVHHGVRDVTDPHKFVAPSADYAARKP